MLLLVKPLVAYGLQARPAALEEIREGRRYAVRVLRRELSVTSPAFIGAKITVFLILSKERKLS